MMVVSRSWEKKPGISGPPKDSSALETDGKGASSTGRIVFVCWGREDVRMLVTIVRERRGMSSFFVRRREAEEAVRAERRARWRGARGTRRLMVLLAMADWMT